MYNHKVFKRILADGNILVFVPSLNFVSVVKNGHDVPDFIESEKTVPICSCPTNDFLPTAATIMTTDKCNLSCCYCYGSFRPSNFIFLPIDIGKKIVDFLIQNALKVKSRRIKISYFGGEPTQHWKFLEEVNAYAKHETEKYGLILHTGISTNACVSRGQADWLISNIDDIQISMDGFKLVQDRHRDHSFDRCYETAIYLYQQQKYFNIRATVSSFSINYLEDIMDFFVVNFPKSKIALEPLSPCGRLSDVEISSPDTNLFFTKLKRIYLDYDSYLKTTLCQFSESYNDNFCGINNPNFFVTPDQRIIACSRITSLEDRRFEFGQISTDGKITINDSKFGLIKEINVNGVKDCVDCFARSTCKGGCPAQKLFLLGDDFNTKPLPKEFCNNICDLTEWRLLHKLNYKLPNLEERRMPAWP